jgi:hypothetical protein
MTEKNGGTARQVCNCLLSVGGWVIKSQGQKKKIYFFTDYFLLFFIGIGEPLR